MSVFFIPAKNSDGDYLHLGRLYLKKRDLKNATAQFLKGLSISSSRERRLESLYPVFKRQGSLNELYLFYVAARKHFVLSDRIDTLIART